MRRLLGKLLGLFGAQAAGGRWGKSPRLSPDELPDWAQEFQGSGWAATPNPQAERSRQQRRVRLLMWLMVSALPVSLLSCLFSVAAGGGSSSSLSTGTGSEVADSSTTAPKAQARARFLAKQWLDGGGLEYEAVTWQGYSESFLPCAEQPPSGCETHIFKTRLVNWGWKPVSEQPEGGENVFRRLLTVPTDNKPNQLQETGTSTWVQLEDGKWVEVGTWIGEEEVKNGTWVRVAVTLDPLTGKAAGISMTVEDASGQNLSNGQPAWEDNADFRGEDGESFEMAVKEKIREWAQAWTTGDQKALHGLHGHDATTLPDEGSALSYPWFGLPGWALSYPDYSDPDSPEEPPISGYYPNYLATAVFSIYQQCNNDPLSPDGAISCGDCSVVINSQRCDGDLGVIMDLKLEARLGQFGGFEIVVKEYGAVGTLSPPEPVDENPA